MFPIIYKFIDDKIKNVYNKGRCKKLADNSIQKESTGYEKKMDLTEGIRDYVSWVKQQA